MHTKATPVRLQECLPQLSKARASGAQLQGCQCACLVLAQELLLAIAKYPPPYETPTSSPVSALFSARRPAAPALLLQTLLSYPPRKKFCLACT